MITRHLERTLAESRQIHRRHDAAETASDNSDAFEDYAAIVVECEKSSVHDLLTDLITEAVSNDYQPNNEAANGAYFTQLM